MSNLERLAAMTATQLSSLLATPESVSTDMRRGEWLATVQILTARLTEEGASLSAQELNLGAAALDVVLRRAEQAGDLDRNEAAIRRLNLTSALLRLRGPNPDVVLLDPRRMYAIFSEIVPLSTPQMRDLPEDWRTLDMATIRRLRLVKNLLVPLLEVKPVLDEAGLADDTSAWEEALPRLP